MNVSLFGALLAAADFTDAEAVRAVQYQLGRLTSAIPEHIILRMVKHWRDYKRDGMSDNWILAELKAQKMAIGGGTATPSGVYPNLSDTQIVNFVTAMKRLSAGDMPENPWERPSMEEAYDMGLGKFMEEIPWGKIALGIGGAILLYGFATGAGKGLTAR